jgi:hypothetical protein
MADFNDTDDLHDTDDAHDAHDMDESRAAGGIPWLKVIFVSLAIVAVIAVCIVIYRRQVRLVKTQPMLIPNPTHMSKQPVISGNTAMLSKTGREYTYNFWINVNDWSKGYDSVKNVLTRSKSSPFTNPQTLSNPSIWFYPKDNSLAIRVSTMANDTQYDRQLYPDYQQQTGSVGSATYTVVNPYLYHKNPNYADQQYFLDTTYVCDVANIPLQRWVMVSVILWNRTLDVYVNGMLVRSAILPGIPLFDANDLSNIYVGSSRADGTFNGHMSRLKYYNRAITANEVMELYRTGPLSSSVWWNNLKHKIKLTLDVSEE